MTARFCNNLCIVGVIAFHDPIDAEMPSKTVNSEVKEEVTAISPFVAPYPNRYRDKFSTPCNDCFTQWCIAT